MVALSLSLFGMSFGFLLEVAWSIAIAGRWTIVSFISVEVVDDGLVDPFHAERVRIFSRLLLHLGFGFLGVFRV